MINQQLIEYIKKELGRGVPLETTKNALMAIGWTDKEIKKAYSSLSAPASGSRFNKKFIWVPLILLLLVAGGVWGFKFYTSKTVGTISPITNTQTPLPPSAPLPAPAGASVSTNPPIPPPVPIISDVDKVTTIVADICQGYITSDNSLIIKHASVQTVSLISNNKFSPVSTCVVNKVYQSDANIIANVTILSSPSSGKVLPGILSPLPDMVFINEGGEWKFDMTASTKFTIDQNRIKISAGDPNGFVDLVVTGAVVSPSHPVVNNKDLKIVLTIKNTGTKTSDAGTPLVVDLLGFKDETPMVGGNYEPLLAGGTTEWTWYPYKYNSIFNVSDTAGQKTIQIKLNPDRKIVESNYDNNVFTQAVQIYAK